MFDIKHVVHGGTCTFIMFAMYTKVLNKRLIEINSLSPSHNFKFMPGSYSHKEPMQHSVMIEGVVMDEKHIKQIKALCNNII